LVYLQPLLRNPSRKLTIGILLDITPFKVIEGHQAHMRLPISD